MSNKLYRGHRNMFRRRRRWVKPLIFVLVLLLLGAGGYFAAYYWNHRADPPTTEPVTTTEPLTTEPATVPETLPTSEPVTEEEPESEDPSPLKAAYFPLSTLRVRAGDTVWLQSLKKAGFNSVIVTLKDAAGSIYYKSETPGAAKVGVPADGPMLEELKALRKTLYKAGLRLVPELYVFADATASRKLPTARVMYSKDLSQCWLDDSADKGGKAWLNPYSEDAWQYIFGYMTELKSLGFRTVMLNGVQFPEQTYFAAYGDKADTVTRGEILTQFIAAARETMGEDGTVMLAAKGLAYTGIDTAVYGDNPVNFGPDIAVPELYIERLGKRQTFNGVTVSVGDDRSYTLSLAVQQMVGRCEMEENVRLTAGISAVDATATQLRASVAAVEMAMGENASYIVYDPDFRYNGLL